MSRWPLRPHPATPCAAVQRLEVSLVREPDGWRLSYALAGALPALRLPHPSEHPSPADGLWRHTCFEAFVGTVGSARYREFNFSPSGDWAAYAFAAERQRDPAAPTGPAPRIACTHDARTLRLTAWLPADALPAMGGVLGLSAVVETTDGALSYWALVHPRAQTDFHHAAGWTARVPDNRRP